MTSQAKLLQSRNPFSINAREMHAHTHTLARWCTELCSNKPHSRLQQTTPSSCGSSKLLCNAAHWHTHTQKALMSKPKLLQCLSAGARESVRKLEKSVRTPTHTFRSIRPLIKKAAPTTGKSWPPWNRFLILFHTPCTAHFDEKEEFCVHCMKTVNVRYHRRRGSCKSFCTELFSSFYL